jgi:hypothetical protein
MLKNMENGYEVLDLFIWFFVIFFVFVAILHVLMNYFKVNKFKEVSSLLLVS